MLEPDSLAHRDRHPPTYEADDLSGAGAKATGGRWNAAGLAVVYPSQMRALACLETVWYT